ncbi:MAG: response regulator [Candidatus Coatesbacteria bacterium]|nr:response regulator [Candidatus Coatesbacteria bacterium]
MDEGSDDDGEMTVVLGFLISFTTWVFPLLALALFSYALALNSKESTGAVHLFFAAFAAFCRNLLILIDFGTRSPFAAPHYRLFLDLLLLLAMTLAVMGSSTLLSVQGISISSRYKRTMIGVALCFWLTAAISGIVGESSAVEVLHYAVYDCAVVCLAWAYLVIGVVAAHHFGRIGTIALRLAKTAAFIILIHPLNRMFFFRASTIPRGIEWWLLDLFLLGSSTMLCGAAVVLIARGARRVELKTLLKTDVRAQKVVSKRSFAFIGLGVIVAVILSLLLIQRSGEELTSAVTRELQNRHLSELMGIGSRVQDASRGLRSCMAAMSEVYSKNAVAPLREDRVFDVFLKIANDHMPCNILIATPEGELIKTDASNELAEAFLDKAGLAFETSDPVSEEKGDVLGPKFIFFDESANGLFAFCTTIFLPNGPDGSRPLRVYLLASTRTITSRYFSGMEGEPVSVCLMSERGDIVLSTATKLVSRNIGEILCPDSPERRQGMLTEIIRHNPGYRVHKAAEAPLLLSYCSIHINGSAFYPIAIAPWDIVLASIDSAYLKQYQLLGFIMVLILFGSIIAVYISTRWSRSLERIALEKTDQLRHEKTNLEQAMRSIGKPLIVVNENLDITYANTEFIAAFSEPLGKKCHEVIYCRSSKCENCLAEMSIQGDEVCHAVRLEEEGPEARCFDITASPKKDLEGNVIGSIILLSDVTERNTYERRIRESEEKYKRLVETSPDMVCIIQSGRLLYANKVLIEKMGFSPKDLFADEFELVANIVHRDWREDASRFLDDLRGSKLPKEMELPLVTKGGQELQVLFRGVPITYGGLEAIEVIFVDITKLKELHRQLLQAERLASLGELTASIAHELNNKLTPILAYSEMLQNRIEDHAIAERLAYIERCAKGAKSVVETLLAFPRNTTSMRKSINLNRLLVDTLQLVKYRLDACNIDLLTELDEDLPSTMVDPKQIEQVFLNIVNNAYQAMEERGGTLYIVSNVHGDRIVIQITDTGAGISEADLGRIFEPFFTTKPAGKGTGLGLPCSLGIINAHDGELRCTSKLGRGTTFEIDLPVVRRQTEEEPELIQADDLLLESDVAGAKILVVDDEEMLRGMVNEILSLDHTVLLAGDGREAIDLLKKEAIEMIVTDLRMPGLDGFALYNWVKENKPGLERRMLFTTGDIYEPRTREFMRRGGIRCISKPFSVSAFMNQVNSVLADSNPI